MYFFQTFVCDFIGYSTFFNSSLHADPNLISVLMGPTEVPSQSGEVIKIPTSHYEFGANFIDPKVCN